MQAVIALGHALDMHVTAEGVERAEQVDRLRALGCDSAQGYYFSAPVPVEELKLMTSWVQRPTSLTT